MKKFCTLFICFSIYALNAQTDVLNSDFETGIPLTYSIIDNDGQIPALTVSEFTSAWIVYQDPANNQDSVAASTSFFTPVGKADKWLITPALNLGAFGNQIKWQAKSHDASYPDDYKILVSTTDNQLSSFTDTIGLIYEEDAEWVTRTVNLSQKGYDNKTIYIAFVNITNDGFKLYLDNIHVTKDDPVLSLNEHFIEEKDIKIFPNPGNGQFKITVSEEIKNIKMFGLDGKLILETVQNEIDASALENGIYLVKVMFSNHSESVFYIKN